jgi:tRNA(Arg) A34 adenosine deaminase TadA
MDDSYYLKLAIEQARKSVEIGGFPAGAILVKDGKIISVGISIGFSLHDPTSHAETAVIREACKKLETIDLTGATLYESVECCVMCFSVAYWSGISKIVYAVRKTPEMVSKGYYEGKTNNETLNNENSRQMEMVFASEYGVESLRVIIDWEKQGGFKNS